ncbi:hypothetical protein D3C78_1753650 [compost metagenome]
MVGGAAALGDEAGRAIEVARFIQGQAFPLAVLEVLGGFGWALLFEQPLALLVGTQPQVIELEGMARLGEHQ